MPCFLGKVPWAISKIFEIGLVSGENDFENFRNGSKNFSKFFEKFSKKNRNFSK